MRENRFLKSLSSSFIVHLGFALLILFGPKHFFDREKPVNIEVSIIEKPVPKAKPIPVEKVIIDDKKQIVDQDEKPVNDETPKEAKYLSAKNQVVKTQTIATKRGDFKNVTKSTKGNDGGQFKPMTFDDMKPKFDASKTMDEFLKKEQIKEKESEEIALKQPEKKEQVKPKETVQAQKPGTPGDESQTIDYIKDLDPGLETMLSTREFVYYTYYARIRKQLNQYWGPKVREKVAKLYSQGRQIASSDDRITKLLVTLDKGGKLVKVQVIGDSGIRELDEAAVEAFRAAGPFPNPPMGMIDPDGNIKIRWDFILEA